MDGSWLMALALALGNMAALGFGALIQVLAVILIVVWRVLQITPTLLDLNSSTTHSPIHPHPHPHSTLRLPSLAKTLLPGL